MVIYKTVKGYVILKNRNDTYDPPTSISSNWKHWKATWDIKTCKGCKDMHGKVYAISEEPNPAPPLHPNCRCVVEPMEADLRSLGQDNGESPAKYIQGKMATMGEYLNKNGHLPQTPGRVWYEADINYYSGKRNGHRIVWSSDGLIFVTYDHYRTFIEVA